MLFSRMSGLGFDPQDSNLVVHDVDSGWHRVALDGTVSTDRRANRSIRHLSVIVFGNDGAAYSILRHTAIVTIRRGG